MKKVLLLAVFVVLALSMATAAIPQVSNLTTDVLGAHTGYGRGCVMCHAPHSGAAGNGFTATDSQNGSFALWGQDLTPLFGKTKVFSGDGAATYSVTLPVAGSITSAHDANTIILFCLSCHDGSGATNAMMKGTSVEKIGVYAANVPTLLGNDGSGATNQYSNDHPVGGAAIITCGTSYTWDCTGGNTAAVVMNGPASSQFVNVNYGWSVSLASFAGGANVAVTCTSCHDQHSQNVYAGTMGGVKGNY